MKAIILNPAGGEVDRLFQYDKGCKIRVYIQNAENVIVDYSCTGMSTAATVQAIRDEDDSYIAEIPNYVLEYGNNIKAHIGYKSTDNRQIVNTADLTVEKRTKPAGYISTNPAGGGLTIEDLEQKKLNKDLGAENAGKALVIGEDGVIIPGKPEADSENVKILEMRLKKEQSRKALFKYQNSQLKKDVSELTRRLELIQGGQNDNKLHFIADYDERIHKRDQFPEYMCTEYKTYAGNISDTGVLTYDENDTDAVVTTEDRWGVIHVKYTKDVVIIFDKIKSGYSYYLYLEKHPTEKVLYAEYNKNDECVGVKYSDINTDTEGKDGIIRFHPETVKVAFYIPKIHGDYTWKGAIILNAVLTIDTCWEPDYYSYEELDADGYLPNPDSGVMDFYYTEKDLSQDYVYNTGNFRRGNLYNRWGWSELYNEETGLYDFTKPAEMYTAAIEEKTRVHDGIFMTAYAGHGNKFEDDEKIIFYLFPAFVFNKAYQAAQYPLRLLKTGTVGNKTEYMAVIDWRNQDCQNAYREGLQEYRKFLETTEHNGIKFIDALTAMQIRFFGLWGEGHLQQLVEEFPEDLEDADTMINMVKMYEEVFSDKILIAPVGGFSKIYEDTSYKEFQNYYLKNSKFGFFNDHIGQTGSFNYIDKDFDGVDVLKLMQQRYKTAPIEGEVYNYGEFRWDLPVLPYIENDVRALHINNFRYTNVKGGGFTYGYDYVAVQNMLKNTYDIAGNRLFLIPICSYISGQTYNAKFLVGNMGVAPIYGDYWMPRIIIRNQAGEIVDTMSRVLGASYDLRNIGMTEEPGVPSWKTSSVFTVSRQIKYNTDYTGCQAFLKFEDTKMLSEPLFLANVTRTENGEYPLGYADLKSAIYEPEDESKYKYLFDITFGLDGANVITGNVTVTEHKGAEADGYTENGWKNTTNSGGLMISGIDTSSLESAKNLQLCVEFSDCYMANQYRKAFLSAEDNVYTVLYSNGGYTFIRDTSDFWNTMGYRTLDGMDTAPRGDLRHVVYYDDIDSVKTLTTSLTDEYGDEYVFGYNSDHNLFDGTRQQDVDISTYIRSLSNLKTLYLANSKNWNVGMIGVIKRAYLRYEDGTDTYFRVKFGSDNAKGAVQAFVDGKEISSNTRVISGTVVTFKAAAGEGLEFVGWDGITGEGDSVEVTVTENLTVTAKFTTAAEIEDGVFINVDFSAETPADAKKHCTVQKTAGNTAIITGIDWSKLPENKPVTITAEWDAATIHTDGKGAYLLDAYGSDNLEKQAAWMHSGKYGLTATVNGREMNGQSNNYPGVTENTTVKFVMHFNSKGAAMSKYDFDWGSFAQAGKTELWCTTSGGNATLDKLSNVLTTWNEIYLGTRKGQAGYDQSGTLKLFKITYDITE